MCSRCHAMTSCPPRPPSRGRWLQPEWQAPEYKEAPPRVDDGSKPPPARTRIGTYTITGSAEPRTAARIIVVARYGASVMAGMAEAAFTALTRGLVAEDIHTLRQGTIGVDLRITTTDDYVIPAYWGMKSLRGRRSDPGRRRGPCDAALLQPRRGGPTNHRRSAGAHRDSSCLALQSVWLHTHGLQKFGRPELDLELCRMRSTPRATPFAEVADSHGDALAAGHRSTDLAAMACNYPDVDHQAPYGRLRLADVPAPGERRGSWRATPAPERMALVEANRLVDEEQLAASIEVIEKSAVCRRSR